MNTVNSISPGVIPFPAQKSKDKYRDHIYFTWKRYASKMDFQENWSWRCQHMEDSDWRSDLSAEFRRDASGDNNADCQTFYPLQVTLPSILKLAVNFEEKVYSLAKDKESQVHKQDQLFTIHHSGLENQHQAAQQHLQTNFENKVPKSNVSLNINLKDSPGDLQNSAENLKGEMEHSGNSGNCEQEQGILHSPQVIAQQNFQQGSCLELQSSTLSMVKSDPQTTPAQQQQTQQAPFTLHNPPSMVEQPLLLSQQKGQKAIATDGSQKLLIAQESRVPDPQHHQQPKLPCPYNDCQSLQSCSPTPEQKLLSQSQPPKLQQILNLSRQDEQQRSQASGTIKSASVTKQEEAYQQAESSKSTYVVELKEKCQRAINLLQQNDFVHQESRLKLDQAMKYLDYPDCNKSTEKLDLIKRQINCVFQFAMPRKPSSSLVHGQLTPNLHPLQKSLQPHPQIHQAMPPEDQKKPPLQSMNPLSSAINLQDSNMRIFGDNSMQYPSKLVISQQDDIKSKQHLGESNSERENVVNPVPQVSMRSQQLPLSTLPQPNDIKFLLENHRNERAKANSRRSSSVAQRMDPKQKKSLHHVSAQKKNQESQQSQMCQQLIKGNQEVPQQMQEDDEMPHQLNEVYDVKMTQGIEHETALNQRPEVKNLKFRQVTAVKSGVPPSISSPGHIQTEPVRLPRHFPLTNQHNMLQSNTIVGSPSHSVNSQPGFSAEFLSNDSSYLNTDGFGFDASTINFGESCDAEKPILRLIKAVNSISSKALSASVSEFGSVVNLADSMAGSVPVYGSKAHTFGMRKVKRSTKAVPLNDKTPACPEKSDSESTIFCPNKKPRIQVSRAVLKEIEEINLQLIDTVLDISDEETDSTTVGPDGGGITIKCSFIAVSINSNFNSKEDSDQISKIQPLKLLVPTKYPYCSPIVLEKLPGEVSEKHDDLSVKARVKLNLHLRNLLQPVSIGEMARTWDKCARTAISEHAVKNGGGCVFSKYGTWENCFSAA
ncbi:hypothetical protein NC651_000426 [Populus alba x Populus x berolinensis]|nr:hypothetical protein NC651_000426 [Populus alba x Populus x berolinensis]